ncbi:MAG: phosphopyruvate hydratase [Bacilli bacterium]
MSKIVDIKAREILDSRGTPTIEVSVITEKNNIGTFSVPSGASTGSLEALELRDNDSRYFGKGVLKAVNNVTTTIKEALVGLNCENTRSIDELLIKLDGTDNKSNLGGNATVGVSIACLKAAALDNNEELFRYLNKREVKVPSAMFNIINGGKHADNNLEIQEFMIVPRFKEFKEILRSASEIFHQLKGLLNKDNLSVSVGDEGGFAPDLKSNKEALSYIVKAIEEAGYIPGKDVFIALDVAANSMYNELNDTYKLDNKSITRKELLEYYKDLVKNYPIISIEDPFYEKDYEGFRLITEELGKRISIVGDDLFVTNKKLLEEGIRQGLCNAILIKPNQIGTFYETLETIVLAKQHGYITIISHRSGETTDSFIADAAVALNIPFIKSGSVTRGERLSKYNRLMEIEEILKNK